MDYEDNMNALNRIIVIYVIDSKKRNKINKLIQKKTNNDEPKQVLDFLFKEMLRRTRRRTRGRNQRGGANTKVILKIINGIDKTLTDILGASGDTSMVNSGPYVTGNVLRLPKVKGSIKNILLTVKQLAYAGRNLAAVGTGVAKTAVNTVDLVSTIVSTRGSRIQAQEGFDLLI